MNRNQKIAVVLSVCAVLLFGATVGFYPTGENPMDINDLGTLTVYTNVMTEMTVVPAGGTATQDLGLVVTLDSTWGGTNDATLKVAGFPVEEVEGTRLTNVDRTVWVFDMESIPAGTNDALVFFGGMYTNDRELIGRTYDFKVYSSEAPTYDPVSYTHLTLPTTPYV